MLAVSGDSKHQETSRNKDQQLRLMRRRRPHLNIYQKFHEMLVFVGENGGNNGCLHVMSIFQQSAARHSSGQPFTTLRSMKKKKSLDRHRRPR